MHDLTTAPLTLPAAKFTREAITLDYLRTLLALDTETGEFTWLGSFMTGRKAGTVDDNGYIKIVIHGIDFKAHRLVWAFVHGEIPHKSMHIDHLNGIKKDNRLANLRLCTAKQNCENAKRHRTNSTGFKGVSFCGNKFRAYICHNRRQIHLGCFATKEEAHAAYCGAADRLGWKVHRSA